MLVLFSEFELTNYKPILHIWINGENDILSKLQRAVSLMGYTVRRDNYDHTYKHCNLKMYLREIYVIA